PDGNLFVASFGSKQILRYNGVTGAPIGNGIFVDTNSAGLQRPDGLVFGPDGNLFVSNFDIGHLEVLRYNGVTGAPVGNGIFVAPGSAGLTTPEGILFTDPQAVPEPPSLILLSLGVLGMLGYFRLRPKTSLRSVLNPSEK